MDVGKIIIAFNNQSLGEWLKSIEQQNKIHIISNIRVFISFQIPNQHFKRANLFMYAKEIVASMLINKMIKNSQQIVELAIEKVESENKGVCIFIQNE